MGVRVAATCLHWSQQVLPNSFPPSQTLASAVLPPTSKGGNRGDRALVCGFVHRLERSALFGTKSANKLLRTRSCDNPKLRVQTLKRACSDSFDGLSDEEFSKKLQELALEFQLSDNDDANNNSTIEPPREVFTDAKDEGECSTNCVQNPKPFTPWMLHSVEPPWLGQSDVPEWVERDEINAESIERKANSVGLPLSLRIIKKKKQWEEGVREAGESAYCSVKKAFSSMVFIIRELHSYSLHMREVLFYEDLHGIIARVQREMHASFVWLFQQVFSHTPTLMVSVMILLANFTVYSMAHNIAIAALPPSESSAVATETISTAEIEIQQQPKFDSSAMKTFSVSSWEGKTTSVGGNNGGGGGKIRPVANGTDGGDGQFDESSSSSNQHRTILPDEMSRFSSILDPTTTSKESESGSGLEAEGQGLKVEEDVKLWNSIVDEASRMQAASRDESLDAETMQRFVSPVKAEIEREDYSEYLATDLLYQLGLTQEPNNPILLSNYAQFLYIVVHDHDRAEEYFKKAIGVEPADAETFSRYASFLWVVRKDLVAAEETYLEALAAEPDNTYHLANYARFLWLTGGEDTCFPLSSPFDDDNCGNEA